MKDKERVRQHVLKLAAEAQGRYRALLPGQAVHDDACMNRAGTGRVSLCRQNLLQDEAMALCGHPAYRITRTIWSADQWHFLAQFTKEG